MTRQALLDLAARCEAATGADRELDANVAAAARIGLPLGCDWALKFPNWEGAHGGVVRIIININGNGYYIAGTFKSPAYTASLDAAMSLVPEGWGVNLTRHIVTTAGCTVTKNSGMGWKVEAATPALALTAAYLRALAQEIEHD